jgi:hypothetical protein
LEIIGIEVLIMRKLKKQDIIDMINSGWCHTLLVCASKEKPDMTIKERTEITTDFFLNRAYFKRWHDRIKLKKCNKKSGLTLKYYLIK